MIGTLNDYRVRTDMYGVRGIEIEIVAMTVHEAEELAKQIDNAKLNTKLGKKYKFVITEVDEE